MWNQQPSSLRNLRPRFDRPEDHTVDQFGVPSSWTRAQDLYLPGEPDISPGTHAQPAATPGGAALGAPRAAHAAAQAEAHRSRPVFPDAESRLQYGVQQVVGALGSLSNSQFTFSEPISHHGEQSSSVGDAHTGQRTHARGPSSSSSETITPSMQTRVPWALNPYREASGSTIADTDSVIDESGRSYQNYKAGKYLLPNDGEEQQRLDFQYAGFSILLDDRLALAPMRRAPKNVIDVATGTGIWAIEFARQNPESFIIGTDLSKIQPLYPPMNVQFEKDDSEEEWLFNHKFDYVHLRLVCSCFDSPKRVIRHAFDNMNPGGWIEFQDGTIEFNAMTPNFEGSALQKWCQSLTQGAAILGKDLRKAKHWRDWLIEAGFQNVVEIKSTFPLNPWPQDEKLRLAGQYMMENVCDGLPAISWKMLSALGMSAEEIQAFLPAVKRDVRNLDMHSYMPVYVVYGQKPL